MPGKNMPTNGTKPQKATEFMGKKSETPTTAVHTCSAPKPGQRTYSSPGGFRGSNKGAR